MDSRLIFLHHRSSVVNRGGARKGRQSAPIGHGASWPVGHAGVGKSAPALRAEGLGNPSASVDGNSVNPMLTRKSSRLGRGVSVPKTDTGGPG